MSRIQNCFTSLRKDGRKALIVYVTAGDPHRDVTVPLMHAMVAAGADLIELGVPFSDPEAEGPVIQAACERALAEGTSLKDVVGMVAEFRVQDTRTPVILMGYLNPLEAMGYRSFAAAASAAGVDGTITVNLPPEEAGDLDRELAECGLDSVYLLAPTTTQARAEMICRVSQGFVYYVSLKGVTGAASLDVASVADKLDQFRSMRKLPIAVGFGIKDGPSAAAVAILADGVVVGSALVEVVAQFKQQPEAIPQRVAELVQTLRNAIDGATNQAQG